MSFTEKIIEEIKQNPELAEQLAKILNIETQRQILEEQKSIKEYLALISEEQKKFTEEMVQLKEQEVKLGEEQVRLREDFNSMRQEMVQLKEQEVKLGEEQVRLREDFNSILIEVHDLRSSLTKTDQRLDRMFSGMIKGFGDLSKFAGISFEELMRRVMTEYLRKGGVLPKGKRLKSAVIDSEQIDMYCDSPPIVGEVTASATSDDDARKLLRKAELVKEKTGSEPSKYLIVLTATREAYKKLVQICKENNVELVVGSIAKKERSPA